MVIPGYIYIRQSIAMVPDMAFWVHYTINGWYEWNYHGKVSMANVYKACQQSLWFVNHHVYRNHTISTFHCTAIHRRAGKVQFSLVQRPFFPNLNLNLLLQGWTKPKPELQIHFSHIDMKCVMMCWGDPCAKNPGTNHTQDSSNEHKLK